MLNDLIDKKLKVIFCGINPGLRSAEDGHHFSRRSNRFWRVLHQAGFTPHEIDPVNDKTILDFGYGLTTAVARATNRADELTKDEFADAIEAFKTKMTLYSPKYIVFLGKPAYTAFFQRKEVPWGAQAENFCGAKVWVMPNTSGLNRGFSLADLIVHYKELYMEISKKEEE